MAGAISRRVLAAALAVAVLDAAFGIAQCRIFNSACTPAGFFRGIASFAPAWFPGYRTSQLGVILHLAVATFWACAYALAYWRSRALRQLSSTGAGLAAAATGFGVFIWLTMDFLVLPALGGGRHTPVEVAAFWVILAGHPLVVGLPITAIVRRGSDQ